MACAVSVSRAASRPFTTTSQPAAARCVAQPRPSPREEAHTIALRPSKSQVHARVSLVAPPVPAMNAREAPCPSPPPPTMPPATARGVALAYAGVFMPLAVQLAFLPVWLEHVGLSPERIGLVLGVPIALRILVTPPLLAFADRVGDRARFYVLCARSSPSSPRSATLRRPPSRS